MMETKKIGLFMSTALAFGLLTGCGLGERNIGNVTYAENANQNTEANTAFHSSIETREENNVIIVEYKVKNISGKEQKLTFPNGLQADYILYDENLNKIKQFSDDLMTTQAIEEVTLQNGEEIIKEFIVDELYNGNYKVEVFLTANEEQAKVMMDLSSLTDSYNQGRGKLVGQIDTYSIEIILDGKPKAFRLTDVAKQQLRLLQDGDTVSFVYTDSIIEQKTIEKFLMEDEKFTLTKSVLEVGQDLVDLQIRFKETKDVSLLKDLTPFEIFQLYMYTKAGEDFETLYYFHQSDNQAMTVEKYKEENLDATSIEQNRAFMGYLNEVREYEVVETDESRVNIAFTLRNESATLEFKIIKGENEIWYVMWTPFQ